MVPNYVLSSQTVRQDGVILISIEHVECQLDRSSRLLTKRAICEQSTNSLDGRFSPAIWKLTPQLFYKDRVKPL